MFGTSFPGRRRPAPGLQRGAVTAALTSVLAALLLLASPAPATAEDTTLTDLSWGDVDPVAGQVVHVTGTVAPAGAREVVLEVSTSSGWTEVAAEFTSEDGSFRLLVPTERAGASRYRVRVAASPEHTEFSSEQDIVVSRRTTNINVTLSATKVRAGARVFVAGRVNPNWNGRKVVLQRRVPGGWVSDSPARRVTGSSYRFRVPTGWYGAFSYRVVVTETAYATQKASDPVRLRVVPRYRPAGRPGAYQPIARSWVRFNPCQAVTYRVNARLGGRGALADVKAAVAQVRRATGLRFRYAGRTRAVPQFNGRDYWGGTDLVVAWARPRQSAALKGAPAGVVGVGGPVRYMPGMRNTDGSSVGWILQGGVVLDATDRFRGGLGRGYTRGEIVLHELGHALGLGHVQDRRQVMYPTMRPNRALLGAGDLSGMEKVGTNRGCIHRPDGQVAQSMWQTLTRYLPSSTAFVTDHLPQVS